MDDPRIGERYPEEPSVLNGSEKSLVVNDGEEKSSEKLKIIDD